MHVPLGATTSTNKNGHGRECLWPLHVHRFRLPIKRQAVPGVVFSRLCDCQRLHAWKFLELILLIA
jgi:hypothetical protein